MKPDEFIAAIAPSAVTSMAVSHIPASFTIAEGALESGWGTSILATNGKNLFGVKADPSWKGDVLSIKTREYLNGEWVMVPALWRKYGDWQGCIDDHAAFLMRNQRYRIAFGRNYDGPSFARVIAAAGYATDPDYAEKLIGVMNAHDLARLDKAAA